MALTSSRIIVVRFHEPMAGRHEYYFGSLRAIYEMFSDEQIGRSYIYLRSYAAAKIDSDTGFDAGNCTISRRQLYRIAGAPKKTTSAIAE